MISRQNKIDFSKSILSSFACNNNKMFRSFHKRKHAERFSVWRTWLNSLERLHDAEKATITAERKQRQTSLTNEWEVACPSERRLDQPSTSNTRATCLIGQHINDSPPLDLKAGSTLTFEKNLYFGYLGMKLCLILKTNYFFDPLVIFLAGIYFI